MNHPHALSPRVRRAGLTIIELVLALAGTGFVAVAIVSMLTAVTSGTRSSSDLRQSVVRQNTIMARLTGAIRASRMVLAASDNVIVLWHADTNGNDVPDLSEIRRIERNTASNELRSFAAPLTLAPASNTAYTLATDFLSVTQTLKGGATFPQETWATGIKSWTLTFNAASTQNATLVSTRMVVTMAGSDESVIAAAALRNSGATSF